MLNHFQCYEIRPPQSFSATGVSLVDQFGSLTVELKKAMAVCAPADKNGEDPTAATATEHLTAYSISQTSPKFPTRRHASLSGARFVIAWQRLTDPSVFLVNGGATTTRLPGSAIITGSRTCRASASGYFGMRRPIAHGFGVFSIGGLVPAARSIGSTRIRPWLESSRSVALRTS